MLRNYIETIAPVLEFVPPNTLGIAEKAFKQCTSLTSITIPENVDILDAAVFSTCTSLTSITCLMIKHPILWSNKLTFDEIDKSKITVYVPSQSLSNYSSDENWSEFGQLLPVPYPYGPLKSSYDDTDPIWYIWGDTLHIDGYGYMYGVGRITNEYTTPWYRYVNTLKHIVIHERVLTVADQAFKNLTNVETVTFLSPSSIDDIGERAFYNCSKIKSIDLPHSLRALRKNTFAYCTGLKTIIIRNDRESNLGLYISDGGLNEDNCFLGVNKDNITLYVPDNIIDTYKKRDGWDGFSKILPLSAIPVPPAPPAVIPESAWTWKFEDGVLTITGSGEEGSIRIGQNAFGSCSNLSGVICNSQKPPVLHPEAFYDVDLSTLTLSVPVASVASYLAADVWKDFGTAGATVTGVGLNKTSASLVNYGSTEPLTDTVLPQNAANKNVTWESSDTTVATVSFSGLVTAVSCGSANITVTTVEGGFTDSCRVTVTGNSDASLKSLTVSEGTLSPKFSPNIENYTVSVPYAADKITVTAIENYSGTTIVLDTLLTPGENTFSIPVKTENGTQKTYTVKITRLHSTDATLKSITLNGGKIPFEFDPFIENHTVSVEYAVDTVTITPEANHELAVEDGHGTYPLAIGDNIFNITVTAHNTDVQKTYTLNIIRLKDNDATLKSLSIDTFSLSPAFFSATFKYSVDIPNEVSRVLIKATGNSYVSHISGTGNVMLNVGLQQVPVTVYAMDGTKKIYRINITRADVEQPEPPATGINDIHNDYNIYREGSTLWIDTPASERIIIYSVDGIKLYDLNKSSGKTFIPINHKGILIIKSNHGWVRKII